MPRPRLAVPRVPFSTYLRSDLKPRLYAEAERRGVSVADLTEMLILNGLAPFFTIAAKENAAD